jgi:hypothetical protein
VTITLYIHRSYVGTGFKHKNKSITGATLIIFRSRNLVVNGEEEAKDKCEIPDSSFVGCSNISTRKRRLPA